MREMRPSLALSPFPIWFLPPTGELLLCVLLRLLSAGYTLSLSVKNNLFLKMLSTHVFFLVFAKFDTSLLLFPVFNAGLSKLFRLPLS